MRVPAELVDARASFDLFFEEERERLFQALYFVTGNRDDAEELTQDAFLKLCERWDRIDRIDDPTGYLFRVALNGFRMRRRRAAMALRRLAPVRAERDEFVEAGMRADVAISCSGSRPVSEPPSCSWTCSATRPSRRRASCVSGRRRCGTWRARVVGP